MMNENFMTANEHLTQLVLTLPQEDQARLKAHSTQRVETAFKDRYFIVYRMKGTSVIELDRIAVLDFECDHTDGASCKISSRNTKQSLVVSYTPTKVFDHDVYVWLPTHTKLRWSAPRSDIHAGSLGFPMVIRTASRRHLREKGVTYCETGLAFGSEFGPTPGA